MVPFLSCLAVPPPVKLKLYTGRSTANIVNHFADMHKGTELDFDTKLVIDVQEEDVQPILKKHAIAKEKRLKKPQGRASKCNYVLLLEK